MHDRVMRAVLATGVAMTLASCAPNGGAPNTAAGLFNPFSGPIDPDLRRHMGGAFDSSTAPATPSAPIGPLGSKAAAQTAAQNASAQGSTAPARTHTVAAGETAWSISRHYGVDVAALAQANGLSETMALHVGQVLAIPPSSSAEARVEVSAPGAGSTTPMPPSASEPLPSEVTRPAASPVSQPQGVDLGATRTAASANGKFRMPVDGPITSTYAKGRNEGIDISASAGAPVKAASGGTVAAITHDTKGQPIVVVRHEGSLMTVYTGLGALSVSKGDNVSAGQMIGKAGNEGTVHFEVRNGFQSVDPADYLG